jgi:hypothetical protein
MNIKFALIELAKLNNTLTKKGGPEKNGHLFEKVMNLEKEILDAFGLPRNAPNAQIIKLDKPLIDVEMNRLIALLHKMAADYLLSDVKTPNEILQKAQQNKEDSIFVLPELKVQLSLYTSFVYDEIFIKQKDSIEHVWDEFKLCKDEKIRSLIADLSDPNIDEVALLSIVLEANVLRYVKQFINEKKNVLCLN